MNTRYLVTGAQGFVGRFVVAHILQNDPTATVLGIGRSQQLSNSFTHTTEWLGEKVRAPLPVQIPAELFASDRYQYESVDLLDSSRLRSVVADHSPTRIIHMASGLFGDSVTKLMQCGVEATVRLLEAIPEDNLVERIVLGSSGGVYGCPTELPLLESHVPSPIHLYSVSKLASEMAARVVARQRSLPIVVARIFNIMGPGQDERHICGRYMRELTAIARSHQPPTLEVGTLDTTRDMIDVRDTASASALLCERGQPGEIYHVASGQEVQMREVLRQCVRTAGLEKAIDIREGQKRSVDIPRHFASIEKLRGLGWVPQFGLEQSLQDLHAYYAEQVSSPTQRIKAGD
ncbi:MAG: GDP-mannose 4,6-dehydratase [Planctomycetota bacterium]